MADCTMKLESNVFSHESRSADVMQRSLAAANRTRTRPGVVDDEDRTDAMRELAAMQFIEGSLLNNARDAVAAHAAEAPTTGPELIAWFETLRVTGPGQLDPLIDWIAAASSEEDARWYVAQETIAETGMADLLTVVDAKVRPRLPKSGDLAVLIGAAAPAEVDTQVIGRGNLNVALANNGRWKDHAVGALIAAVLTVPRRALAVEKALTRLGYTIYPPMTPYDPSVVSAIVERQLEKDPASARALAEGALMFMHATARALDSYRRFMKV